MISCLVIAAQLYHITPAPTDRIRWTRHDKLKGVEMGLRFRVSLCALAIAPLLPAPASGQAAPSAAGQRWNPPLTPDGRPDLQGIWENNFATPLERPKELAGRQFLTDGEIAELKARASRIFANGRSDVPAGDDFFLAALANLDRYKRATSTGASELIEREWDNRTSMIIDPPDGKLQPYTPEGLRRAAAAPRLPSSVQDLTNRERCIIWGVPVVRPDPYANHYQIVQTREFVVVMNEMIHEARMIPMDGRPHLPASIRAWAGDSRGRWEGQTLVVDSTNFSPKSYFLGSAENLHLVERFTRIVPGEMRYEITVDDPTTWTASWTAVVRLRPSRDRIYEFACHEGNLRLVEGIL